MKKLLLATLALISLETQAFDPLFKEQWGLLNQGQKVYRMESDLSRQEIVGIPGVDIDWPSLEELAQLAKKPEVIVAVIDSGIDMFHPEFKGRLFQGRDFLDDGEMSDDSGHGTHVAGIIAANADGVGTQGVTPPNVKILPLKVLKKDISSFHYTKDKKSILLTDIFANAIAYAVEAKASVINMSLGWPQIMNTPRVIRALDIAAEKGVVVVAASGNNNKDVPTWPCAHTAVICVGAIDGRGYLTEFTNHGGKVDIVAPGEWIVSTIPRSGNIESYGLRISGYDAKNGSSQAAPFVSAAVALLKLQNPNMTIEEVKHRLYSSARKLKSDKEQRFVRFGALSIKDALKENPAPLASVSVKNISTIGVDQNGAFQFSMPIEILGQTTDIPEVSVEGLEAKVQVADNKLFLIGKLESVDQDSEVKVTFTVKLGEVVTKTSTTLSFARKIGLKDMVNVKIPGLPAEALMAIQGGIRTPRIFPVMVEDKPSSDSHFYVAAPINKTDLRLASFRASVDGSEMKKIAVNLPNHYEIFAVYEKDINLDGKNDLMIYGLSREQDNFILSFFDLAGNPLFGKNSIWQYKTNVMTQLPSKGEPAFSWIKIKSSLVGEVLVPYFPFAGPMPEQDNSKNILDFERQGKAPRFYYLEPYTEGEKTLVRPRVVDSVAIKKQLRKTLMQNATESVYIERLLPQSAKERLLGINRHLVSVGNGFNRRFYSMTVSTPGSFSIAPLAENDSFISNNNVVATRSLNDYSLTQNSFLMALLNRFSARVKPLIFDSKEVVEPWNLQTTGWMNQFQDVVGSFESDERKTLFIESRYHVYVYDKVGSSEPQVQRLPINRDSALQQVQFSETLQTVLVREGRENQPAVAINSIQIFGDRLYSMVTNGESFVRPVALSVVIPANCVPFRAQMVASLGHSAYTMLCSAADGGAVLSFFPLRLN